MIATRLEAAAREQGRCKGCVAPTPVPVTRRGDGVNWTVAKFPDRPAGCADFIMKVLREVMITHDLVTEAAPVQPKPATADPARQARLWRDRAEELRSVAGEMNHPTARNDLITLAERWEAMAEHAGHLAEESKRPSA